MSVSEQLREVDLLRYRWVDLANVVRAKGLFLPTVRRRLLTGGVGHEHQLKELLATSVSISQAQFSLPVVADAVITEAGLLPVRDLVLEPDLDSLVVLPYASGQAAVACDVVDRGEPSWLCPRTFLRRVSADAEQHGWTVRVGIELEFVLLRAPGSVDMDPVVPADASPYAAEFALDLHEAFLNDVSHALQAQDVMIAQIHAESAPGQLEISLWHRDPVAAADAIVTARQTIRAVARKHALIASFLPVVDPAEGGSGMHVHFSLTGDADDGLGSEGPAFVAGVLESLPALLAVTAPTPMSYARFRPHFWAGAFHGWGYENKEVPLRITRNADGTSRDVEYKAIDATANPYLAIGAVIAAGLAGARRLAQPPAPVGGDPGLLGAAEREALGASPLPADLDEPHAAFAASAVLREAFGERLHDVFQVVKREEAAQLEAIDPVARRALLLERY